MKTLALVIFLALACAFLVEDAEAFRGGFRGGFGRGFGFRGGFGRWGWGGWGRWGWGWGGFGWPWWLYGGYPGLMGPGFIGKRDVADVSANVTSCLLKVAPMDQNVTLTCKSPSGLDFSCDGLSNLNPAWKIKLEKLALIPVDHTAPITDWDVKVLAIDEQNQGLKNFTTVVEGHELTLSLVANETNMVPGYLFEEPCWTTFINTVKETKFEDFDFQINDE